jgi:hypothetical protein
MLARSERSSLLCVSVDDARDKRMEPIKLFLARIYKNLGKTFQLFISVDADIGRHYIEKKV